MDINDKQLERLNQLLAMAWTGGKSTPEAENAWRALARFVEQEKISGTDVKLVRYDQKQEIPEAPDFAPPPPQDNDPAAQEAYLAEMLGRFQAQKATEDAEHQERMAERLRMTDLQVDARWRAFEEERRKAREELRKEFGGTAARQEKSPEDMVRDIIRSRRRR